MTKRVTDKQQAVLDCITAFMAEKGYGPTVREICDMLGLSSPSTVHVHLKSLEKKGMITRDPLKSRSIMLTQKALDAVHAVDGSENGSSSLDGSADSAFDGGGQDASHSVINASLIAVPLIGEVAAGIPILAEQNIVDTYYLPTDIVSDSAGFMLKVHGESMIEAGINDGDYVVCREQPVANNGDIVVAVIDDSATVKRFYLEKDHVRLQPENSSMEPIIVDQCTIAGKVVAVFRRL